MERGVWSVVWTFWDGSIIIELLENREESVGYKKIYYLSVKAACLSRCGFWMGFPFARLGLPPYTLSAKQSCSRCPLNTRTTTPFIVHYPRAKLTDRIHFLPAEAALARSERASRRLYLASAMTPNRTSSANHIDVFFQGIFPHNKLVRRPLCVCDTHSRGRKDKRRRRRRRERTGISIAGKVSGPSNKRLTLVFARGNRVNANGAHDGRVCQRRVTADDRIGDVVIYSNTTRAHVSIHTVTLYILPRKSNQKCTN